MLDVNKPHKQKGPGWFQPRAFSNLNPATTYSPIGRPYSTIGAGGLNDRVRDGIGCITSAIATGSWFGRHKCPYASLRSDHSLLRTVLVRLRLRSVARLASGTFLIGLKILSQLNTGKHNLQGNNSKYGQAARPISTGKLQPLLAFHIRPINLVVYEGSLGGLHPGIPYLGGGFPLICFQRLSCPHIATRRCGWRHNRNTSGASFPVLSY